MQEDFLAVFPLPNVIFFPGVNLPLHIFEPRYCEMVRQCSRSKMHIGIFLLQPGWELDYYGNPPVFPVGCAGEIIQVQNLPDEKYNIILKGVHRVREIEEIQENPFRKARVEILPDALDRDPEAVELLRKSLQEDLLRIVEPDSHLHTIEDFVEYVNSVAMHLQLDTDTRYRLLAEDDVFARAQVLGQILHRHATLLNWTNRFTHLRPQDPSVN